MNTVHVIQTTQTKSGFMFSPCYAKVEPSGLIEL